MRTTTATIALATITTLAACGGGSGSPVGGSPTAPGPVQRTTGIDAAERTTGHLANPSAGDLAEHWHVTAAPDAVRDALNLKDAEASTDGRIEKLMRDAGETVPAGLEVLGRTPSGYTIGRWTAGPADHMPVTMDFRFHPTLPADARAQVHRAGKLWSHHIQGLLAPFMLEAGYLVSRKWAPDQLAREELRLSAPLHGVGTIVFMVEDEAWFRQEETAGVQFGRIRLAPDPTARPGYPSEREHYRVQTGAIGIARASLGNAGRIAAHEVGHVLYTYGVKRSPWGDKWFDENASFHGPAATAVHGGPVPFKFQPAGINSNGDPYDASYDTSHWGYEACPSAVTHAFCTPDDGPSALDVAVLEDVGYDTAAAAKADAPELYALGAWGEASGFSVEVTRTLNGYHDGNDRLQATATAWGIDPGPAFADAHADATGSATWEGVLLGADLGSDGLPPVTGEANVQIDLATLRGTAAFSDLQVLAEGQARAFRLPDLQYAIRAEGLGDNVFGDDAGHVAGRFYGSGHKEVAGTLNDPGAELIGAFGGRKTGIDGTE